MLGDQIDSVRPRGGRFIPWEGKLQLSVKAGAFFFFKLNILIFFLMIKTHCERLPFPITQH